MQRLRGGWTHGMAADHSCWPAVHGAAVSDINDHHAGLVMLHAVNDPAVSNSDP